MTIRDEQFVAYCQALKTQFGPCSRVLLVQIPQAPTSEFDREVARQCGYYAYPPTGLQCLADAIATRGIETRILDLNFERLRLVRQDADFDPDSWLDLLGPHLEEFAPQLIGVSCMYDSSIGPLLQVLEYLRRDARSVVIAGGVIASYEYEALLRKGACHFVIQGEGEERLNYLLDHLTDEDRKTSPISGVFFRGPNDPRETLGSSRPVELVSDLVDSYELIPIEEYVTVGSLNPFSRIAASHGAPYATIQMNRGCRGSCTFCSVRDFMGKGVRHRPVELVLREMEYLVEQRGIRHFEWLDDDLLSYKDEFIRLLRSVIERQWDITWSANNGLVATSIDGPLLELMCDSGCIGFKVGIESGSAEVLKATRKPATIQSFHRLSRLMEGYQEVFVGGNFMIGFPGETFGQMLETFRLCLDLKFDWAAFSVCQAIRGASAFSDFEDYFSNQISTGGDQVQNFIPSRESRDGTIAADESVKRDMDVFALDSAEQVSPAQTKEVWFTFNLLANFIFNKNLEARSAEDKFIPWVETALMAYPHNPYMSLFLSIASRLAGYNDQARAYLAHCQANGDSPYWRERFRRWGLDGLVGQMRRQGGNINGIMEQIRGDISAQLKVLWEQ